MYIYVPICIYYVQVANKTFFKCSGLWSPSAVKISVCETPSCETSLLALSAWCCLPEVFPMPQYLLHLSNPQASWWPYLLHCYWGKGRAKYSCKDGVTPSSTCKITSRIFPILLC